jgi:tRNA pseudouridine38-40 synthase
VNRYFVQIQYKGTNFSGWQYQPNARTIQEEIEVNLSKIQRVATSIVGCGRTDSGVHASDYIFHFDGIVEDCESLKFKLNRMLPKAISISRIAEVRSNAHARFDAVRRSYEYHIHRNKSPFLSGLSYHKPQIFEANIDLLNETAACFLMYDDFFTFCKSNTDVKTTLCDVQRSEWVIAEDRMTFHVAANRFLRGMVRLMVGCCINVAEGKVALLEVKQALEEKRRLVKDLSVPAEGLFLSEITYPKELYLVQ